MKEENKETLPQDKDRHLDIPSEANRDKHINFVDLESGDNDRNNRNDKETEERQRQWREGIEEGKKAREGE